MPARPDRTVDTPDGYVCMCVIGPAHGVHGAVKAKCFAENPSELAAYGPLLTSDGESFKITSVKPDKLGARLMLDGIHNRNQAEALRGTALFVAREKLPELADGDDFYHADLIGLEVVDGGGTTIGHVMGVHNFGAGDLLEVAAHENGADAAKTAFYRFTKAVVPEIDIANGRLTLLPPQEDEARPPAQTGKADE